jgi:hypothetical protein
MKEVDKLVDQVSRLVMKQKERLSTFLLMGLNVLLPLVQSGLDRYQKRKINDREILVKLSLSKIMK